MPSASLCVGRCLVSPVDSLVSCLLTCVSWVVQDLLIKVYPQGLLSSFLGACPIGTPLRVTSPEVLVLLCTCPHVCV